MANTFYENINQFINFNAQHLDAETTAYCSDVDCIACFYPDDPEQLICPEGLHIESDYDDEFSEQKCYFLVDDESGEYAEILPGDVFWTIRNEQEALMNAFCA